MLYDVVLWVASLPQFVIYAAVGAISGACGALVAWPLSKLFPRASQFTTVFFIVLSIQITPRVVLPWLNKLAFEAGFMKGVGELPRQIDNITIFESAGVYEDAVNYNFRITEDIEDKEFAKAAIAERLAEQPDCKELTGSIAGYVSAMNYRFETNLGTIEISLKQSDCR